MEEVNHKLKTKNDLYRYLKYKGKYSIIIILLYVFFIADVCLPAYSTCRLSFL